MEDTQASAASILMTRAYTESFEDHAIDVSVYEINKETS